ncbi:MAG: bifunctional riboflavin kinase/FAD synthetase [Candidatus Omnitrophota bacterium]|nr:bifunctional riboflavin kinase/FAD synthetase [Candidatus Omnitrophota bacterium]
MSYPTIVTIGIFDGVHKGHQVILKKLVREARRLNLKSVAVTFDPHPVKVMRPGAEIPFLISLKHRLKLIKKIGVDRSLVEKFTRRYSRMSAEDFVKRILVGKLNIRALVSGENFLFGFREKGDAQLLKKLSGLYGFKLYTVRPLKIAGDTVSSTRIRKAIERGCLGLASKLMGRPISILGTVVKGKSLGRKLGFPTANIDPHHEAIPPSGVYKVDVITGRGKYKGLLNISGRKIIEVHILNFSRWIYGMDIEVIFKTKIREEKRFKSLEALKRQIALDIQKSS